MQYQKYLLGLAACGVVLAFGGLARANQLTQQFVNPVFGGNPQNGNYLLGLASANNNRFLTNPQTVQQQTGASAAATFQQEITSSLLSGIAATISQQIVGQNAPNSGHFVVGGEIIDFTRAGGQINVSIVDSASGGTTNIQLPVPAY
jgi:curli production assembly/transport component CsgF